MQATHFFACSTWWKSALDEAGKDHHVTYEQGSDPPEEPTTWGVRIGTLIVCILLGALAVTVFRGLTAPEERFEVGQCLRFDDGKYLGPGALSRKQGLR